MKILRKIIILSLFLFLGVYTVIIPDANTNAKTLGELKTELSQLKSKKAQKENEKQRTQGEINSSNQNIANAKNEITVNQGKIEQAKKDILNWYTCYRYEPWEYAAYSCEEKTKEVSTAMGY